MFKQQSTTAPPPLPMMAPEFSLSNSISTITSIQELKDQLEEKKRRLDASPNAIGRSFLMRQIHQLQDRINQLSVSPDSPAPSASASSGSITGSGYSSDEHIATTQARLKSLERDLSAYRSKPNPLAESEAVLLPPPPTGSTPTKRRSKIPNKDKRNTDIEFATEIGQGLLLEVRKMQTLLQEKEELLKASEAQLAENERSMEGLFQQLKQKEEIEERFKEETWNLELARQELTSSVTELQQHLGKSNNDQQKILQHVGALQTDLDSAHVKEEKQQAMMDSLKVRHEQDMAAARRSTMALERERADHYARMEALESELALLRTYAKTAKEPVIEEPVSVEQEVPETSLKPKDSASPVPIVRQPTMELETLKTSLAHAHRMVSNLRSNLHKEKTEKFELKKLLGETQEQVEQLQNDPRMWVDTQKTQRSRKSSMVTTVGSNTKRRHVRRIRGAGRLPKGVDPERSEDEVDDFEFEQGESGSDMENEMLSPEGAQSLTMVLSGSLSMADELNRATQYAHLKPSPSQECISTQTESTVAVTCSVATQTEPTVAIPAAIPAASTHSVAVQTVPVSVQPILQQQPTQWQEKASDPLDPIYVLNIMTQCEEETFPSVVDTLLTPPDTHVIPARPTTSPPASLVLKAQSMIVPSDFQYLDKPRRVSNASSVSSITHETPLPIQQKSASESFIGAITQTMIGDWLWKYTRKTVGGGLSERRHRRFFWLHPYTRTLYWNSHAPGKGDDAKTRSAVVESVNVMADPLTCSFSLILQTSARQIRLTAPTEEIHAVWYEALHHLLYRDIDKQDDVKQEHSDAPTSHASDNEETLEDVRMCCNGKHHVSHLDKAHHGHSGHRKKRGTFHQV
ncbi:meiotic cell cortex C-terminal pleckstrin homology-domain-containing protein [Spinellus fusiger]|nr:meiotic cell cortex C-terminal pleckstrin homology-domain-containing protein [Spinellus fusiger]